MKIGILALQGGFEAHARVLTKLDIDWQYVRTPEELNQVNGMILPGGESSTLLKLLQQNHLYDAIAQKLKAGMPFFGTCAGAILLAKHVNSPKQISLGAVDITVERNAYGRQLASHITHGHTTLKDQPMEMFFIRAPRFRKISSNVSVLADYQGEAVCVQQDNCLLATFHPELTHDTTLHQHFLAMVAGWNYG